MSNVIEARVVRKPRKLYRCGYCGKTLEGLHIAIFGGQEVYLVPWWIRLHVDHVGRYNFKPDQDKIDVAVAKAEALMRGELS